MKKSLQLFLSITAFAVLSSTTLLAQNLLTEGDMASATGWDTAHVGTQTDDMVLTWNYADASPTAGIGGCLRVYSYAGSGDGLFNNDIIISHKVTLSPGKTYYVTGAVMDNTVDGVVNFWCEVGISVKNPKEFKKDGATYIMAMNTWDGCGSQFDGTFQEGSCKYNVGDVPNPYFKLPDSITVDHDCYLAIEIGTWNDAATERYIDYLIDEMSVVETAGTGIDNLSFTGLRLNNFPNPVTNNTLISYTVPESGLVQLSVFNILGEEVLTLVNETMSAGTYNYNLDASVLNDNMYFYTLKVNSMSTTKKMAVIK